MLQQMVPDLMDRTVYNCGPEAYMQSVRGILDGLGFPREHYHEESFGGVVHVARSGDERDSAHGPSSDVSEQSAAAHSVQLSRSGERFVCQSGETLLQGARRNGAWIPCACEMGVCGSCKVRKLEGEVTMNHMGGVSPEEEADGYVLACCSYPRGHVTLDC